MSANGTSLEGAHGLFILCSLKPPEKFANRRETDLDPSGGGVGGTP
jgi:hypothetical protein